MKPSCFGTEQQYQNYRQLLDPTNRINPPLAEHCPCFDCNPAFQAEAIALGLCDHPDTIFFVHHSGTVRGRMKGRGRKFQTSKPLSLAEYIELGGTIYDYAKHNGK